VKTVIYDIVDHMLGPRAPCGTNFRLAVVVVLQQRCPNTTEAANSGVTNRLCPDGNGNLCFHKRMLRESQSLAWLFNSTYIT